MGRTSLKTEQPLSWALWSTCHSASIYHESLPPSLSFQLRREGPGPRMVLTAPVWAPPCACPQPGWRAVRLCVYAGMVEDLRAGPRQPVPLSGGEWGPHSGCLSCWPWLVSCFCFPKG